MRFSSYIIGLTVLSLVPLRLVSQQAASARVGVAPTGVVSPTFAFQGAPKRREGGRVVLQFLAASAGAVGGGVGTFLLLRDVGTKRVEGDAGYTRAGNVGYLVGSFVGSTAGAHLVGTRMGARSPLWATSLGALLGTVPILTLGIDEPYLPLFGLALGWIPQAALATIGFRMGESR